MGGLFSKPQSRSRSVAPNNSEILPHPLKPSYKDVKITESLIANILSYRNSSDISSATSSGDLKLVLSNRAYADLQTAAAARKSQEECSFLKHILKRHYLFSLIPREEVEQAISAFERIEIGDNEDITCNGDDSLFSVYFVQKGAFYLTDQVHKNKLLCQSEGFITMSYFSKGKITLKCHEKGVLWGLEKSNFIRLCAGLFLQMSAYFVRMASSSPLFKLLSASDIEKLSRDIIQIKFRGKDYLFVENPSPQIFFYLSEGMVSYRCNYLVGEVQLGPNDCLGFDDLLRNSERNSEARVLVETVCFAMNKDTFMRFCSSQEGYFQQYKLKTIVRSLPQFNKIYSNLRDDLLSHFEERHILAGEEVFKEFEDATHFIVVSSGELQMLYSSEGLPPRSPSLIISGSTINCNLFLVEEKNIGTLKAITPSVLMMLRRDFIKELTGKKLPIRDIESQYQVSNSLFRVEERFFASNLNDYTSIKKLGKGAYGLVRLVKYNKTGEFFAMKLLQMAQIVATKQEENVMNERNLLVLCRHPFIQRIYATYKDSNCLYMIFEFVRGGTLDKLILDRGGSLPLGYVQFYAASIVSVLGFLHGRNVLYRDLKSENIMIQDDGFIRFVDFGFAKQINGSTLTMCGTPEYFAPELVLGRSYNQSVDYWALGVLVYEMLSGVTPFFSGRGRDALASNKNILRGNFEFHSGIMDFESKDFIQKLIEPTISLRLGCSKKGIVDLKEHIFFRKIVWDDLEGCRVTPPFVPKKVNLAEIKIDDTATEGTIETYKGNYEWTDDF